MVRPAPARANATTRARRRPLLATAVVSAAATFGGLFLVHALSGSTFSVPRLVSLRESAARERIRQALPGTAVQVTSRYSLRAPAGRVLHQEPAAGRHLTHDSAIRLVVSKGTPFADVPDVSVDSSPSAARATLAEDGFKARYQWAPSWSIRKGAVIELQPRSGTRIRRPARVKVMISSGYPRATVPNVLRADLVDAQTSLHAKHLQYQVVYRAQSGMPPDQVISQIPAAGATVYQGTRVHLTVTRTLQWEPVLSESGTGSYVSDTFTVPTHWRIRYRFAPGWLGTGVAQISWAPNRAPYGGQDFVATATGRWQTRAVSDGAGTYRLGVQPYAGTRWSVEIDALR